MNLSFKDRLLQFEGKFLKIFAYLLKWASPIDLITNDSNHFQSPTMFNQ